MICEKIIVTPHGVSPCGKPAVAKITPQVGAREWLACEKHQAPIPSARKKILDNR